MDLLSIDLLIAFWLGVTTSISPCPLATNIAAISYVGRKTGNVRTIIISSALYTLGRTLTYIVVGYIITKSILSIPHLSLFLQINMNRILGPILILVAIILIGIVDFNIGLGGISERIKQKASKAGIWAALILGILFALTFCPVSAALFFGSLIPISVRHSSAILVPAIYGVGTAIPVIVFGLLMSISTSAMGKVFNKLSKAELWIRRCMALIFLSTGVYMTIIHTLGFFN